MCGCMMKISISTAFTGPISNRPTAAVLYANTAPLLQPSCTRYHSGFAGKRRRYISKYFILHLTGGIRQKFPFELPFTRPISNRPTAAFVYANTAHSGSFHARGTILGLRRRYLSKGLILHEIRGAVEAMLRRHTPSGQAKQASLCLKNTGRQPHGTQPSKWISASMKCDEHSVRAVWLSKLT